MDIRTDVFNTAFREEPPASEKSLSTAREFSSFKTGSSDLDAFSSGLNTVNSTRWPSDSGLDAATTTSNSVLSSWYLETARADSLISSTQSSYSSSEMSLATAMSLCSIEESSNSTEAIITTTSSSNAESGNDNPIRLHVAKESMHSLGDGAAWSPNIPI